MRYGLVLAVLLALAAPAVAQAGDDKISATLRLHRGWKQQLDVAEVRARGLAFERADAVRAAIYVTRRLDERRLAELEESGIRFDAGRYVPPLAGRHPYGYHVALVPYAALDALRARPAVLRVDSLEFLVPPNNNLARPLIGVEDVQAGNGVVARDGSGVGLAVADSGLEIGHPDIPTPVEAFDVTDGTGPGNWGGDVSNTVVDHGTHVTGVAVASGGLSSANSGNGGGDYRGMAPGASLYFYKIGDDVSGGTTFADMIEAVERAAAVGSDVFTMSYGSFSSEFLDGSSSVCQAIDNAVAGGLTVFTSAGNRGHLKHHDAAVAPPGGSGSVVFRIGNGGGVVPLVGTNQIRIVWRDGAPGDGNVTLAIPNLGAGETLFEAAAATSPRGTETKLYLFGYNVPAGQSRDYTFRFDNGAAGGAGPLVHAYRISGRGNFPEDDPAYTIVHPALCDGTIAVGAWAHRDQWTSYDGQNWNSNDPAGALAGFSSRGPRIDGRRKPEIVAPGSTHISTRDRPLGNLEARKIDNDGAGLDGSGPADYYALEGTSQASPAAAGAAALVQEADPNLAPSGIRYALQSTASLESSPDDDAGHGLIDALAAIQGLPAPGSDLDGDHRTGASDCNDGDPSIWAAPSEVPGLRFLDPEQLVWDAPAEPGAMRIGYDTLRSGDPADFDGPAVCLETDGDDRMSVDGLVPPPGGLQAYLVRARNACPAGVGTLGTDSAGTPRPARTCP